MKRALRVSLLLVFAATAFAQFRGMHGGGFRGGFSGGGFRGGFSSGGFRGGFAHGGFRGGFAHGGFRGGAIHGFRGGFVHGGFRGGAIFGPGFGHRRDFTRGVFFGHRPFLHRPYSGFGYGYSSPIFIGGFGYGYSVPYYAPPVVHYLEPYGPPAPIVVHEQYRVVRPEPRLDYDNELIYLIAFKDGTIRAAVAYWTSGRTLHYVDRESRDERTAPLESVDRELSRQLNRERRVPFWIPFVRE